MKGSPLRELCLVVIAGLLLLLPLRMLTRRPHRLDGPVADLVAPYDRVQLSAWLDVRTSHPPERVEISQGDRLLWEGGGDLREDGDLTLEVENGQARLEIQLVWPEAVPQAYAELTLEVEGQPAQSSGFWGQGTLQRSWIIQGETRP